MSGSNLCIPRNETAWPRYFQNYNLLSPNFYTHVSVSDSHIPGIGLTRTFVGIYINHSQIHECRNLEEGHTVSFLGIYVSDFEFLIQCNLLYETTFSQVYVSRWKDVVFFITL
jgi:hypothetical protein